MADERIILIIAGMCLVTYLPRMLPLAVLSKATLPGFFIRWLKYIPPAILAALLAQNIFLYGGKVDFSLANKNLLASIPCFAAAIISRNLFITVVTGVLAMVLLNILSGALPLA